MTTYSTRTLAEAVIGAEAVEANAKTATRTLRKFLRADAIAQGGKVGIDTPGKGGRYAIDLNKRELTALTKRFKAWEIAEKEAQEARRAALGAKKNETPEPAIEAETDNADEAPEGPSDAEILEMLEGDDEA